MTIRDQRCEYCSEFLGRFAHNPRYDGHLTCGAPECSRQAAKDERDDAVQERDEARAAAEGDDYARYRGAW